MKIMIEQRSPEWHEFRKNKIGASEIGTIMGLNPYETRLEWWKRRKGLCPEKTITPSMQYGIENEDRARQLVNDISPRKYVPAVYQSDKNDFMIASVDGINFSDGHVLEIKCSKKTLQSARTGKIEDMYIAQCQMQMYCCDALGCKFVAYHDEEACQIEIYRDEKYIERIIEAAKEAKRRLDENEPYPDDFLELDIDINDYVKVFSFLEIQNKKKELEKTEKELRFDLAEMTDDGNTVFNYKGSPVLKMTRILQEGRVDYDALYKSYGITEEDLKKFRKPQIGFWKIEGVKNVS